MMADLSEAYYPDNNVLDYHEEGTVRSITPQSAGITGILKLKRD